MDTANPLIETMDEWVSARRDERLQEITLYEFMQTVLDDMKATARR
jgi:hypothetical protein